MLAFWTTQLAWRWCREWAHCRGFLDSGESKEQQSSSLLISLRKDFKRGTFTVGRLIIWQRAVSPPNFSLPTQLARGNLVMFALLVLICYALIGTFYTIFLGGFYFIHDSIEFDDCWLACSSLVAFSAHPEAYRPHHQAENVSSFHLLDLFWLT
jgi:hypothetical protein